MGEAQKRNQQSTIVKIGEVKRSVDVAFSEQRERISNEMEVFMNMTEREQRLRMNGAVPSVEEYWEYRLGSSAVSVTLAVNESVAPRSLGSAVNKT